MQRFGAHDAYDEIRASHRPATANDTQTTVQTKKMDRSGGCGGAGGGGRPPPAPGQLRGFTDTLQRGCALRP
jgi:hypothetical protein